MGKELSFQQQGAHNFDSPTAAVDKRRFRLELHDGGVDMSGLRIHFPTIQVKEKNSE